MDKSDLRIEQLQQYLDKKKGVVESDIKEYNQQLGKNYLHFFYWHADDLYKACYMDKNYKLFLVLLFFFHCLFII